MRSYFGGRKHTPVMMILVAMDRKIHPIDKPISEIHNILKIRFHCKSMKGKFVQEHGKTYFQDAWGTNWSEDVLDELIKGLRKYKDAKETIEYYEDMASKVKFLEKE